jgi:hypothetical protein
LAHTNGFWQRGANFLKRTKNEFEKTHGCQSNRGFFLSQKDRRPRGGKNK